MGCRTEELMLMSRDTSALASELWRIFLIAMALALILEAVLSLPSRKTESSPLIDLAVPDGSTE